MSQFRRAAVALLGAGTLLALAACSGEAEAPASETETTAAATEALTITNPRLVLAPVAGNPAAVYFDLSYSGDASLTLASVAVEGAGMTMMHQTIEKDGAKMMMAADPITLAKGTNVAFVPGGLHVMAMQPSDAWMPGGSVNVTLTLSDGTAQTFAADVRAAGDAR